MAFARNVFINCPFDEEFLPLLRPLLFCVLYMRMEPRLALERLDSSEARIEKIIELIEDSRFGIHDLSRLQADHAGQLFRLNMPLELGLDIGCRRFRGGKWTTKKCLILEEQPYRYQAAISDLSNSDIAHHNGKPVKMVEVVRNWLNGAANLDAPGPSEIWARFTEFMADNFEVLKKRGFSEDDIKRLPINELVEGMKNWIKSKTKQKG